MRLREIVQRLLHQDVPPTPPSPRSTPTPEELRWARAEKDAMVRRAMMLGVDVDLERSGR